MVESVDDEKVYDMINLNTFLVVLSNFSKFHEIVTFKALSHQ
jgi:hypothetical protein